MILTDSLGKLATTSDDSKSHTLHGPLLLFAARNFPSELKLRSLIDVLVSASVRTDSMAGHLKTLKCPSYKRRIERNEGMSIIISFYCYNRSTQKQETINSSKHKYKIML